MTQVDKIDECILEYVLQQNRQGYKPDSVGITCRASVALDISIAKPLERLDALKAAGMIERWEHVGGFNGNNWHNITQGGVERLQQLTASAEGGEG